MKSMLPAVIAILLSCLPAGGAVKPGPNLVADGGFEAGPWTPENDQQAAQVDLAITRGGFQSGRLVAVPDRARWVYTVIPVRPPGRYLLSAWIRCEGVTNPRGVSMYLLEWGDQKPIGWLHAEPGVKEMIRTGGTHNWRRFAVILPPLRPETRRAALYFATAAGAGHAWIDDVEVRAVEDATLPEEYRASLEEIGSRAVGAPAGAAPAGEEIATRREPAPRLVCGPSLVRGGDFERIPVTGSKPAGELDTAVKHGGAASLRVTGGNLPLLATEPVQAGDDYRFSIWVRTENVPRNGFSLRLWPGVWNEATMSEVQFRIGGTQEWTRHEIFLTNLPAGLQGKTWYLYYDLQPSEGGRVWVDDAEIVPLQDTLRVSSARPGHLFTDAEPAALTVTARRVPPGGKRFVAYELTDFWGRPAGEGRVPVSPDAADTGSAQVPLKGRGYYRVDAALEDDQGRMLNQAIVSAGVLAPPSANRPDPESIFACWGGRNDLASLLGVRWNRWMERATDFTPDPAKPGAYEWTLAKYYGPYDPRASRLKSAEAGISTYLCFHNSPEWMRKRPDGSLAPVPVDWKLWADWVRFVYGQVKDVVSVVEVYNEPVIPWGWAGTPEEIVALHRATYQAVKSVNPKAVVLGPCDSELEHLDTFGRLGGFRWVDGIALHPYRPGSPEATDFVGYLRRVKTLLKRYNAPTDLWITEMGWTTAPGRYTEVQQANYIVRTYVLALAEGVRHLNVHIFRDWNTSSASEKYFGIVRTDDTPKPAAVAYATLTRALAGAEYVGAIDWLGQTTQGHIFRREGRPVLVLWDAAQERTKASLPVDAPRVILTRIDGRTEERDCPGGELSLELGESPVFITGASPALYLAGPTRALSASPDPLTLAAGDTAMVTVRVRNPRNEPLSAELLAETQEPCAVKPGRTTLNLKAGASADVPLSVSLPADSAPRSFPLFLRLQQGDNCLARTAARVDGIAPLGIEAIAPTFEKDGRAFVTARVTNRSKQPARVSVALAGADGQAPAALSLQPGAAAPVRLPMTPAQPDPSRRVNVALRAANAAGGSVGAAKALNFTPCPRARGTVAIDGDLSDWTGTVEARFGGDWAPMNPTIYRGEGDCAASFRSQWDARHWYLAVDVRDDVFRQTHSGSAVWQQDNIQVGLDPNPEGKAEFNPLVGFYGKTLFEYGLSLTPKGPEVWRWLSGLAKSLPGEHAAPEVRLAVKREGARVFYEAAFPWASLGLKAPKPGSQIGLALAANDDDGEGRKAILWFDGIVHGKDPSLYGRITFTE